MKIQPQLSHKFHKQNIRPITFAQSNTFFIEDKVGTKQFVDTFVKQSFKTQNNDIYTKIYNKVYTDYTDKLMNKVKNLEKYTNPINKAFILSSLADSMYKVGNIEKAAIILATAFYNIEEPQTESEKNKYEQIVLNPANINILSDFYQTSPNKTARLYTMESLRKLNSPYYLPIAENILEFDSDTAIYSDPKTSLSARRFLHQHYNFNLLRKSKNPTELFQNSALSIFQKWGIPEDISIIEKYKETKDIEIKTKANNVIQNLLKLNNTSVSKRQREARILTQRTNLSIDELYNEINKGNTSLLKELKNKKLIEPNAFATKLIQKMNQSYNEDLAPIFYSLIGQSGSQKKHLEFLKPNENEQNEYEHIKAEAYQKVLLRSNKNTPSFSGRFDNETRGAMEEYTVWNNKAFDPINATPKQIEYFAKLFNNCTREELKTAIEQRYSGIFMLEKDKKRKIAYKLLFPEYLKIQKQKENLIKLVNELSQKELKGQSNIAEVKINLSEDFLLKIKASEREENKTIVDNGLFIYGKSQEIDKNKLIEWLKNKIKELGCNFTSIDFDINNLDQSFNNINNQIDLAKKFHEITGKRTILQIRNIDKLLTNLYDEEAYDYIDEFKTIVENANENYLTFLISTSLPKEDFDSAVISEHRFININLKAGIDETDKKILDASKEELKILEQYDKKLSELYSRRLLWKGY